MNAFVNSIQSHNLFGKTTTTNGIVARNSSTDPVVDLFYQWGASRNLTTAERLNRFQAAFQADPELSLRLLLWGRDIREGAGERNYFREVLSHLAITNYLQVIPLLPRIAELGRADDLFTLVGTPIEREALAFYAEQLHSGNGLFFKWAPREKSAQRPLALKLRHQLGMTSRQYRKFIVAGTSVVEQPMCAKQWSTINYSHVPSRASALYSKAFNRNDTDRYQQYLTDLVRPEQAAQPVKINASAIYPYDVIRGWEHASPTEAQRIEAQWAALPNWMNDVSVLPMIDTSGSMTAPAGKSSVTCLDVATSLGLYVASKSQGAFRDVWMEFSSESHIQHFAGDSIITKLRGMKSIIANTNLDNAFKQLLSFAIKHKVPQADMPKVILIFSDMQFDMGTRSSDSAQQMIKAQYKQAGYDLPVIVYWNLNSHDNVPVKAGKPGTVLVSGFSPSLVKSILSNIEEVTPRGIMMKTLMNPRYDF